MPQLKGPLLILDGVGCCKLCSSELDRSAMTAETTTHGTLVLCNESVHAATAGDEELEHSLCHDFLHSCHIQAVKLTAAPLCCELFKLCLAVPQQQLQLQILLHRGNLLQRALSHLHSTVPGYATHMVLSCRLY